VEVYAGLRCAIFGQQGPARLNTPDTMAFDGVDPRTGESGKFLTLGINLDF
jgi:hypothetical protein